MQKIFNVCLFLVKTGDDAILSLNTHYFNSIQTNASTDQSYQK